MEAVRDTAKVVREEEVHEVVRPAGASGLMPGAEDTRLSSSHRPLVGGLPPGQRVD
jgi:hypothetical protein